MPYNRRPQRAASNPAKRDNSSLSSKVFVRVSFDFAQDHELVEWRRFEGTYRPVFVRSALAREYMNMIMVRKDYSVRSSKPNPCMPGLGQGHGKKRHLHAQVDVSSINNPEAPFDLESLDLEAFRPRAQGRGALDRLMAERKHRGHLLS